MAELAQLERLQPSLLDRLTDDEPSNPLEARDDRTLSIQQLRASVLRDLAWLFNCTNLSSLQALEAYPEIQSSVLNYGLPEITGQVVAGARTLAVERAVTLAIREFEPRILPRSLKVTLTPAGEKRNRNALAFVIEGELFAQPVPQPLYLRTELDLEMGQVDISSHDGRGGR